MVYKLFTWKLSLPSCNSNVIPMFRVTKLYTITPCCYRLQPGYLSNKYYKMPKFNFFFWRNGNFVVQKCQKDFKHKGPNFFWNFFIKKIATLYFIPKCQKIFNTRCPIFDTFLINTSNFFMHKKEDVFSIPTHQTSAPLHELFKSLDRKNQSLVSPLINH